MSQASPLDYATPQPRFRGNSPSHVLLVLAVALAAGFLEANAFADAAGIAPVVDADREPGHVFFRVVCGFVVGFVALAIMLFLVRSGHWVIAALGRTREKPTSGVAIICVITGAVCLLGALAIPLLFNRSGVIQVNNGQAAVTPDMPMLVQLLAALTFVAGAFLIGFGIWGGVGRKQQ